ncbi:SRPBCC family protein [Amycolatopsis suaedae]|uniref:SRPBCC domain-containing protein n=1 Tax=Amycolatopsis suaedae TaxID=2510978 RepID=A0A4Q7J1A5_9PSEU|nr:SRPBCC domain-containing protein [Amycolatopsis suaedae]RZQ60163.1 SRPBCC domain-containing protein [Amycolatopsis suaedae]
MSRTTTAIHNETFFPHPVQKVWRAITDPDAIAKWLMPNDFKPEIGHRFTFRTDPIPPDFDGVTHCEVIELDEPNVLAYTFRGGPGLDTVMRFRLQATERGGVAGTLLIGEHSGFDLTNPAQLEGFRQMAGGWGGHMVVALGEVLDQLA